MLLAASMVAGALLWGSASAHALARTAPGKMILFGSSSMNGIFGYLIAADFEQAGFDVTRKGISAAGLARPDFRDLPQILGGFPISRTTTSVLLYIGGNDGQSLWLRPEERTEQDVKPWVFWKDERWPGIYEARMTKLINSLCERGVQHAFVLPPADVESDHLQKRLERVRALQQHAVSATKCGRFIPTMGDRAKRFELAGQPLRSPDGVHMNRAGASLVWTRIRERVFTLLGTAPPAQNCERCMIADAIHRAHQKQSVQSASAPSAAPRSSAQAEPTAKPSRARTELASAGETDSNSGPRNKSVTVRESTTSTGQHVKSVTIRESRPTEPIKGASVRESSGPSPRKNAVVRDSGPSAPVNVKDSSDRDDSASAHDKSSTLRESSSRDTTSLAENLITAAAR